MSSLRLYGLFHLNLAYSSIEANQHAEVIERCYWPLLRVARDCKIPLSLEATGWTLERIAKLDPSWLKALVERLDAGELEFVGSGYCQIIGPLVPAQVNAQNQRLGQKVYRHLLGREPRIALVNEQAFSMGLVEHYLTAGYQALIMEWENAHASHPEWEGEWRYLPQRAQGCGDQTIPVIWNSSISFQKLQRVLHGEMTNDEYRGFIASQRGGSPRFFSFYGNDAEVFDFRPGCYHTETELGNESEWLHLREILESLNAEEWVDFIPPSRLLEEGFRLEGAGQTLQLCTAEQPIPVKKQDKYNILRWAVSGRHDLLLNTRCWRVSQALQALETQTDDDWKLLCRLWSSDYRTHITVERYEECLQSLAAMETSLDIESSAQQKLTVVRQPTEGAGCSPRATRPRRRFLELETPSVELRLDARRGLAIDSLRFKELQTSPILKTLHHGYFDDIRFGADYYNGHLVCEQAGQPKVTDLEWTEAQIEDLDHDIRVVGSLMTGLGGVRKELRLSKENPSLTLRYELDWRRIPIGSLRLAQLTLNPEVFAREELWVSAHNGGFSQEAHSFGGADFDHGAAVSFLVSAQHALGMTEGVVRLGDAQNWLEIKADMGVAAPVALLRFASVGESYFCRLSFSLQELDDTSRQRQPGCSEGREIREASFTIKGAKPEGVSGND